MVTTAMANVKRVEGATLAEAVPLEPGDEVVRAGIHATLDQAPAAFFESDADGNCTFVNRKYLELTGLSLEQALGDGWTQAVHLEDRDRVLQAWEKTVDQGRPGGMEYRFVLPDGSTVWVSSSVGPILAADGTVERHVGLLTDITARIDTEQYLERSLLDLARLRAAESRLYAVEQQFRTVFERSPLGISIVGLDGRFIQVNEALLDMTGYVASELVGELADLLLHEDDKERVQREVITSLFKDNGEHVTLEQRLVRKDGRERWVLSDSSVVRDGEATPLYLVTMSTDITDRKMFEERLAHEASHDPLTGLPNRSMLYELMQQSLARTQRRDTTLAVMFVDLDRFKQVNDEMGHAAGDELLDQVASRLRSSLRLGDVVARFGGDEFVVLCEDIGGDAGAEIVANRICAAMANDFTLADGVAHIGASIGVALSDGSEDTDALLRAADGALYDAKDAGRGRVVISGSADLIG